ncbi:MAG: hypothetical protein Kow00124_00300 [Anaerolineae bacterium]
MAGATGVTTLASLFTLLANILIYRILPGPQAGQFALLVSLVRFLPVLATFGQPALMMRLYSHQPAGHYHWPRDLAGMMGFSLPLFALVTASTTLLYRLALWEIAFVVAGVFLLSLALAVANLLNAQRHYVWAVLLLRLPNSLMIIPAVLVMLLPRLAGVGTLLAAQLLAIGVTLGIGVALLAHRSPIGAEAIPVRLRWQGLGFGFLSGTNLLLDQGLVAIAGAVVPPGPLAAFAAVETLIRPLYTLQGISRYTLAVETVRHRQMKVTATLLSLLGLAAVVGVVLALLLPALIPVVYAGRYDDYIGLALPVVLMGSLLLAEAFPRSFVIGRAPLDRLNLYTASQVLVALIGLGLVVGLGMRQGIMGAAWAGAITALLRALSAYSFYFYLRPLS